MKWTLPTRAICPVPSLSNCRGQAAASIDLDPDAAEECPTREQEAPKRGPSIMAAWTAPSHWRTRPARAQGDATDPRLSGTWTVVMNGHGFGQPGTPEAFGVYTGTARLENEDGAWVGEAVNFNSEPYERIRLIVEGEGAYEGWNAIIDQADQEWSGFRGVVFGGGLPPLPEPVEPSAE